MNPEGRKSLSPITYFLLYRLCFLFYFQIISIRRLFYTWLVSWVPDVIETSIMITSHERQFPVSFHCRQHTHRPDDSWRMGRESRGQAGNVKVRYTDVILLMSDVMPRVFRSCVCWWNVSFVKNGQNMPQYKIEFLIWWGHEKSESKNKTKQVWWYLLLHMGNKIFITFCVSSIVSKQ